jgi:inner membrane protein
MNPASHFLISWLTANTIQLDRRERFLITFSGLAPDADGLGIIGDFLTRNSDKPLQWWGEYHHLLGHNLVFGCCLAAGTFFLAKKRKAAAALLSLISFHLHLFCDLIGSRGPDGYQWPLPYLWPFSDAWQWTWKGQWALDAWPNLLITVAVLAATFYLAWQSGRSPLEFMSSKVNAAFVASLRSRFGEPRQGAITM